MDTIQINKNMSENKQTKKYYKGCFPADRIPNKVKRPALIVVNTANHNHPGEHWCAFYLPKKGKPEFFDSIGRKPNNEHFLKFLAKQGNSYIFNSQRLQGSFTSVCGQYCLVYLLCRSKRISKKAFLKLFGNNLSANDQKIEKLYKKNFVVQQVGANSVCVQTCQPSK